MLKSTRTLPSVYGPATDKEAIFLLECMQTEPKNDFRVLSDEKDKQETYTIVILYSSHMFVGLPFPLHVQLYNSMFWFND